MNLRALLGLPILLSLSCAPAADSNEETACPSGFARTGSTCAPRFDTCPEAELPTFGGGCLAIGPTCGEGFRVDAPGSCAPILPKDMCPSGQLAVPGDATCRAVDECGAGPFGAIADEPGAKWVDAAAAEGGDGSREKPFRAVRDALLSVGRNGLVGIAAGKYELNVDLAKSVRIQGRCSSMVELFGAEAATKDHVLQVTDSAHVEVRDVALTGPYIAVGVYDADVTLERVWIHDTGFTSIEALTYGRVATVTMRDSLVERAHQTALLVSGAQATLERSTIRETLAVTGTKTGDGALVKPRVSSGTTYPGKLVVRRSLFQRNLRDGITLTGASLDADGLVILGMGDALGGVSGPGLVVQKSAEVERSDVVLKHGWFAQNTRVQISVLDANVAVSDTVARDGVPDKDGANGGGFFFGNATTFTLTDSLAERTPVFGLVTEASSGTVERTIVRDIRAPKDGSAAIGIQIAQDKDNGLPSNVTIERSLIARCPQAGLLVLGSEATAKEVAVLDVQPLGGLFGDGFAANTTGPEATPAVARLTLDRCLVLRAARAAVTVFGATLNLRSSRLGCGGLDLNFERDYADAGETTLSHDVDLDADDSNVCGCGDALVTCRAQSIGLSPVGVP